MCFPSEDVGVSRSFYVMCLKSRRKVDLTGLHSPLQVELLRTALQDATRQVKDVQGGFFFVELGLERLSTYIHIIGYVGHLTPSLSFSGCLSLMHSSWSPPCSPWIVGAKSQSLHVVSSTGVECVSSCTFDLHWVTISCGKQWFYPCPLPPVLSTCIVSMEFGMPVQQSFQFLAV